MKRIYLLRHGETPVTGKYLGSTDLELSSSGKQQLLSRRKYFQDLEFKKVLCSPMLRCRQSLNLVLPGVSADIVTDLREIDFGAWEMKGFDEIAVLDPVNAEKWALHEDHFCFPSGECIHAFRSRLREFAASVHSDDNDCLLIVSHAGVIRHLICLFLHLPLSNYLLFKVNYGSLARIDLHSEGGVLTALNS